MRITEMFFKTLFQNLILIFSICMGLGAHAEKVSYLSAKSEKTTDAILTKPTNLTGRAAPAIVLLHHGGGCINSQTPKYAEALSKAGYFTIEPCLFKTASSREKSTVAYLPQVFGALRYLANIEGVDKNRIAVTGGSYGGALAMASATNWAYQTHSDAAYPPFAAHAPFYPVCYAFERFLREKIGRSDAPGNAYDKFNGAKVRIYAAGKDDYDSRDPKTCESMVGLFHSDVRDLVSLRTFSEATHGWDHPVSETFFDPLACKGRGCTNTNQSNPQVTQDAIVDLIEFLASTMISR